MVHKKIYKRQVYTEHPFFVFFRQLIKAAYNFFLTVANARNGWRRIRNILTVPS